MSSEAIRQFMGIEIESNGEKAGREVEAGDFNVVAVVNDEFGEWHGTLVFIDDASDDEDGVLLACCYVGEPLHSEYFECYYDELRYATDAQIAEYRKKCVA